MKDWLLLDSMNRSLEERIHKVNLLLTPTLMTSLIKVMQSLVMKSKSACIWWNLSSFWPSLSFLQFIIKNYNYMSLLTSSDSLSFSFLPEPFLHSSSSLSEEKKYQRSAQRVSHVFTWGFWQSIWVPSAGCLSVFIKGWAANIPAMPHRALDCAEDATSLVVAATQPTLFQLQSNPVHRYLLSTLRFEDFASLDIICSESFFHFYSNTVSTKQLLAFRK